ncbi:hypothetical protein PATSB16_23520 [Pandoraea thiooxydans]|uniref:Uncharacterized protein n=1 Tax=Pandoraea thiooxydans TaxID=445709 RepID=A0A0G3EQP3_9BURK|nr:hypothetical protein [Pandoraea thiooxydans]AKJ68354.1 hypothetical protein ABW99_09125 [Pandoraea thiooxydans]APR95692.1 hypothetical protein PATSB16_23520 [Pandoraea thiooxydans]
MKDIRDIQDFLKKLAGAEPYRPANSAHMQRYRKLSVLVLGLGAAALVLLMITAYSYHLASWPPLRLIGAVLALFTMFLALASMLIEPYAMLRLLWRWKTHTLETFQREIENDERHVAQFARYDKATLGRAQAWLQLKVKRLDAPVGLVFGSSAALWSIAAVTITNVKDAGGRAWLHDTFLRGFTPDNWANTMLLWGIALVFGLSIGAALRKVVLGRYNYQLELVDMALARKADDAAKQAAAHQA